MARGGMRIGEVLKLTSSDIEPKERIFLISYPAARMVVKKAGELVGILLKPHDRRRHAATYASRSGTPIEIVSKVILALSQTEWVNSIPSPSDGGGLGWGCFRSEQNNNIGESPQEMTRFRPWHPSTGSGQA